MTTMTNQEIDLARATAQAAGLAASKAVEASHALVSHAVSLAAVNASKAGWFTSEFKATCLGILVAGAVAALHVLAVVPSPIMPAAIALTTGLAVASYSISRGNVKAAALNGAAAIVTSLVPGQAVAVETTRTVVEAVIGGTTAPRY